MTKFFFIITVASFSLAVLSCCEPKPRNSYPMVIDSSYSVTAIKDDNIPIPPLNILDSVYYPIYSMNIKNVGSEADTFQLLIILGGYDSLVATQYVGAGETKNFKTYGPIPSNSDDSAKGRYFAYFVSTPDSLDLRILRPSVSISYGKTLEGVETCGNPAQNFTVNIDSLGKK